MYDTTESGLIVAHLLDGKGGGQRLDWNGLGASLPAGASEWIHLDRGHADARSWLHHASGLTRLVAESLLAETSRPHCTQIDDGIMLFLRAVNLNPGADPDDMVSIRLWVEGQRIISVRKRPLLSVEDLRQSIEERRGPRDAAGFLTALVSHINGRISRVIEDIDDRVDDMEQRALESGGKALRSELIEMRQQIIALRRYLAPQRDALERLTQFQLPWLEDLERLHLREEADRVARFVEDLNAGRERVAVIQEELSNRISEQINTRMYVLSVVAALFLPLGFLTGLFGVNVGGIPLANDAWGFAELAGLLALIAGLQLALFRWKDWF